MTGSPPDAATVRVDLGARSYDVRIGPGKIVGSRALALVDSVLRLGGAVSSVLKGEVPAMAQAPIDYESITGTYRIADGVLSTRDLRLTSRLMQISVAGTYGLGNGAMDFDTVVHQGGGQIRAKVSGTSEAPSIRITDASGLRSLDPAGVRRGLDDLLKRFR